MSATLDEIWIARDKVRERLKSIGEPVIELPGNKVIVTATDGVPRIFMRMDDLIHLATTILDKAEVA